MAVNSSQWNVCPGALAGSRNTPMATPRWLRAGALVAASTVALLVSVTAWAWNAPLDQVFPDEPPAPVASLAFHAPGVFAAHGLPGSTFTLEGKLSAVTAMTEPGRGAFWRFKNTWPGLEIRYKSPHLTLNSQAGATWSLWYRHPPGVDKLKGFNPLMTIGDNLNWEVGLVLYDGIPRVVFAGYSQEVFQGKANENVAIDDGQWHHVVLRVSNSGFGRFTVFVDATPVISFDHVISPYSQSSSTPYQVLSVGRLNVNGYYNYPGQSNYNNTAGASSVGPQLRTVGDIDEIRMHEGPLSLHEIQRLRRWPAVGVRLQVPDFDVSQSSLAKPLGEVTGFNTEMKALPKWKIGWTELNLATLEELKPTYKPKENKETFNVAAGASAQLGDMKAHTVMAWMNLPAVPGSGDLLEYDNGAGWKWTLRATASTLSLTCTGGVDTIAAPGGDWPAGQWHVIGVQVSNSGAITVHRNFQRQFTFQCSPPTLSTSTASLSLLRPDLAALAWLAVVDSEKSLPEQAEIASPGPLRWVRPPGTTDLSGLHHTAPIYTGAPVQSFAAGNDVRLDLAGTAAAPNPQENAASRPVTLAMRYALRAADGALTPKSYWYSWLGVRVNPSVSENDFYLSNSCFPAAPPSSQGLCWLTLYGPAAAEGPQKNLKSMIVIAKAVTHDAFHTLAMTSPITRTLLSATQPAGEQVYESLVALDGEFLNRKTTADAQVIVPQATAYAMPWAATINQFIVGLVAGTHADARLVVDDLRIYGRVVKNPDSIMATCATLDCSKAGRVCVEPPANTGKSAYCGGCLPTHNDLGGVTPFDHECEKKYDFWHACTTPAYCLSNYCDFADGDGKCALAVTATQPVSVCTNHCADLGRHCTSPAEGVWNCGGCFKDFAPLPPWDLEPLNTYKPPHSLVCGWAPTKKSGAACEDSSECHSGLCGERVVDLQSKLAGLSYPPPNLLPSLGNGTLQVEIKQKICAASWAVECTAVPVRAAVAQDVQVTLPNKLKATARWCTTGKDGACAPNYERKNPVLSTAACVNAAKNSLWATARIAGFHATSGMTLARLKLVFLNLTTPVDQGDRTKLLDAGVGLLLIDYALATAPKKAAMVQKYGKFEPLYACDLTIASKFGGVEAFAATSAPNHMSCTVSLQVNGSTCPPAGDTGPGHNSCRSNYCRPDTKVCADALSKVEELKGDSANKNKDGDSGVKFGLLRTDSTMVELVDEEPDTTLNKSKKANEFKYKAKISQKHTPVLFGKNLNPAVLFGFEFNLDRSAGAKCGTTELKVTVLGTPFLAPKPMAVLGSCTGYELSTATPPGTLVCDKSAEEPNCTGFDAEKLANTSIASLLIPKPKFCAAIAESLLEKATIKKDFTEALVPLGVSIGPTIDVCIEFGLGVDESGMPQVEVTPNLALGVEAKGGIGVVNALYEVWAGVKLSLTLVGLKFPITWGLALTDVKAPPEKETFGMFELSIIQKVAMAVEVLSGEFSLFAEFTIAFFSLEWSLPIFNWQGLFFTFDLSSEKLFSTLLDFRAQFDTPIKGAADTVCDEGECFK